MTPPPINPTRPLYIEDSYSFRNAAIVVALRENEIAVEKTCFYPGGGGQPSDTGVITSKREHIWKIVSIKSDPNGVFWHVSDSSFQVCIVGEEVLIQVNRNRRHLLMRYHTALHVLNSIVMKDYEGWITGVQMGEEYSRIDFKLESVTSRMCQDIEEKANSLLSGNLLLKSYWIDETEFATRKELLRTLDAQPPVVNGKVRVVEIEGFDAQACGGTHVKRTSEVGKVSIFRTENKGKVNKRFYIRLENLQVSDPSIL